MKKIDCFGDMCPVPLLKMNSEIRKMSPGDSFQMVVDHSCVIESIKESLQKSDMEYTIEEVLNGVWEITLKKHR